MEQLNLGHTKPLAFIKIQTTGMDFKKDRIIESIAKLIELYPDNQNYKLALENARGIKTKFMTPLIKSRVRESLNKRLRI